ncbi:cytosine deaminase [Paenibacillus sp. J45TS6]|uniref:amidohydrolase family protein n=1 Tax=unclassified Paenibacillus TaxID=185978 RepID=UPI001B1CB4C3|nr:amidohydrolase family protein [Paenibacillus sp. J45TS6]GIP44954.1 cytosine deaminase [Paenibacillus sp. J45TS6]
MAEHILQNVVLLNGQRSDIYMDQGKIIAVRSCGTSDHKHIATFTRITDGKGGLVMPAFAESHIHLDTVLTAGQPAWNTSGTLSEGIAIWSERKQQLTREDIRDRAMKVIRQLIAHGVLFIRSHADISDPNMTALQTLLELKEELAEIVTLQVIAFPQNGIIACPGNRERMEEALRLGADGVGAIPHGEKTREHGIASLEICFELAQKANCFVHVFCDETDDPESRFLEWTAVLAMETGLRNKVTASHCCASAYYNEPYFQKVLSLILSSGIHIVVCPLINSSMQGRFDSYPKGRGIARIQDMLRAGIPVAIAHDDLLTPFYSYGDGNLLQAVHMAAHLAHMTGRNDVLPLLDAITEHAAEALGLTEGYGVTEGCHASLVVLPVTDPADAIRLRPKPLYVLCKGEVLAHTPAVETAFNHESITG